MRIAIMPGHGNPDPGAVNTSYGETEAKWNWNEAELLHQRLTLLGHKAIITRTESARESLSLMQKKANDFKADICFCLHHNACNGTAHGWLVFCSEKHVEFGERVVKRFQSNLNIQPLGKEPLHTYEGTWHRVGNCISQCEMPTVLLESCFIDNEKDCFWLINGGWKQVVNALCDVVYEIDQEKNPTPVEDEELDEELDDEEISGSDYDTTAEVKAMLLPHIKRIEDIEAELINITEAIREILE